MNTMIPNLPETQYSHLRDAINHHKNCPICHAELPNDSKLKNNKIYVNITSNSTVEIDILTNQINIKHFQNPELFDKKIQSVLNGMLYEKYTLLCCKCYDFYCTMAISINLASRTLDTVFINADAISIKENDNWYRIRNNYVQQITEVFITSTLTGDTHKSNYNFPLINFDFNQINNTFDKIKKFILFS